MVGALCACAVRVVCVPYARAHACACTSYVTCGLACSVRVCCVRKLRMKCVVCVYCAYSVRAVCVRSVRAVYIWEGHINQNRGKQWLGTFPAGPLVHSGALSHRGATTEPPWSHRGIGRSEFCTLEGPVVPNRILCQHGSNTDPTRNSGFQTWNRWSDWGACHMIDAQGQARSLPKLVGQLACLLASCAVCQQAGQLNS